MDFNQVIDRNIEKFKQSVDRYPMLHTAAVPLAKPSAPILGRDMGELRLGLRNPEKANVILLGEPGSGKTAYMQGFTYDKDSTPYLVLSVDVERFVKDSTGDKDTEMANGLMDFVAETSQYSKENDVIVILFIDEFHRIAMVSPSAVEALKPILEKSAHNGFRVVAATTFEEYDEWIAPNRALDQRLLRITLPELPREAVIKILQSRAKQHGALELATDEIFGEIFDISKRILISNSQPRASIDILLNMIGNITKIEYMRNGNLMREYATPEELGINAEKSLSRPMLNRVIQRAYGIDIDNKVSIPKLKNALHAKILNQEAAVKAIISRLELSLTGFNDPTRPKISFLSTGSTGVGKSLPDYMPIPTPTGFKRNGDLKVGDQVFDAQGKVTTVTGVYPQGERTVYEVEFIDGRIMECSENHLWTYKYWGEDDYRTKETGDMIMDMMKGAIAVPICKPVEYPKRELPLNPYAVGQMLGEATELRSDESITTFIDEPYKTASVEQRLDLIRGIVDTIGVVHNGSLRVTVNSYKVAKDLQEILWSCGLLCDIEPYSFASQPVFKCTIHGDAENIKQWFGVSVNNILVTDLLIRSIRAVDEQVPMTCIMVDNDDHLYVAGREYIVTHNTELAKVISEELDIPLKRFDMSRYPRPEDAVEFANQLAHAAWSAPNGYILIDEVEKATRESMNILLQVLDDARLTAANNPNRVISFTGNIINLTTNLGSEVYDHNKKYANDGETLDIELIYDSLAKSDVFETAVLGRLDAIVPFQPLSDEAMSSIAQKELQYNLDIVETLDRPIMVSKDIIPFIIKDRTSRDTERGGARDAKRNIKNVVIQKLASYLAEEPPEVPLILRLTGIARFRDKSIADIYSADVEVIVCYPRKQVNTWVAQLSKKVGRQLYNGGLFIPIDWSPQDVLQDLVELVKAGNNVFFTDEYDTENQTEFFINGDVKDGQA